VRTGVDGGEKVGNSHATAPAGARLLNFYDLVRLHKFGELDVKARAAMSDIERDMADAGGVRDLPSTRAMTEFCRTLPEVVAEKKLGDEVAGNWQETGRKVVETGNAEGVRSLEDKLLAAMRKRATAVLVRNDTEYQSLVNDAVLIKMWRGCFYHAEKSRFYLLNRVGRLIMHVEADWSRAMVEAYGKLLDHGMVDRLAERALPDGNATARQKAAKEIAASLWGVLKAYVKDYKQRAQISYKVDPFADVASITTEGNRAIVTFTMPLFPVPAMPDGLTEADADAILDEYKGHVPMFDELLDAALDARFANDRRQGYVWLQAGATFGKDLLMEGVLGAEGLKIVARLSIKDIEAAGDGSPVGFTVDDLVGKWILYVPESHTVKRELKELNNELSANPKNQLRFTTEIFLKVFVSAEGIEALTTSNGVESQFADRFSSYQIQHDVKIDARKLFQQYGKPNYKVILRRYAAMRLNAGIERMRALGRVGAWMAGDRGLDEWHKRCGIAKSYGRLDDSLEGIAAEIKALIMQQAHRLDIGMTSIDSGTWARALPRTLAERLQSCVSLVDGGRYAHIAKDSPEKLVIVQRPTLLVHAWMDANMTHSEKGTMSKKAAFIADLIAYPEKLASTPRYYVMEGGVAVEKKGRHAVLPLGVVASGDESSGGNVLPFNKL
jgi:hypothetical protein